MAITARFGLSPAPYDLNANGIFNSSEEIRAIKLASRTGADNINHSVAWDSYETSAGVYSTGDLTEVATYKKAAMKIQLSMNVIQYDGTNQLPAYLVGNALDSTAVKNAFHGVIDSVYGVVGADGMDIFLLGNEVEGYLEDNPSDITPFANLIADAKAYINAKTGWANVKVGCSFKHDNVGDATTTYASVLGACTLPIFTFYPLNLDLTVKYQDPETMYDDIFDDLLALPTAVSNTCILSEIGFPSHADCDSSPELQAAFYENVFDVIQFIADFDGFYSAMVEWQTDWPEWLLDFVGFTGIVRSFVGSLGLRDQNNLEKPAWPIVVLKLGGTLIGSVWKSGSWVPTAWAEESWAESDPGLVGEATLSIVGSSSLTTSIPLIGSASASLSGASVLSTSITLVGAATLSIVGALEATINPFIVHMLEFELDGFMNGWTVCTDALKRVPIRGERGLPDSSPRALVAKTGPMMFALDNSEANSEKTLGLWSPGHANCKAGFAKGIGVRFSIVIDGVVVPQYTGRLENIRPEPGEKEGRATHCLVLDFMNETAKKRLSSLTLETDIDETDAFEMIVDTIPLQPRAVEIGTAVDTLEYAFDTVKDDRTSPMNELQRLNQSTLARTYVKANGTLVYEPRSIRALNINDPLITLDPGDFTTGIVTPDVDDNRATVINRVTARLHPRTRSAANDVVLYESESVFAVPPLQDILIRGYYSQETLRVRRAGGLDMLPAVAVTDYEFNTEPDGSGTDVTADVVVDTIYTANSVLFTINSPVAAYAIKLQSRGTQIVDNANMGVFAEDVTSINEFGEVSFDLDMPYVSDPTFGNEVVQYILYLAQNNVKRVQSVKMLLNGMTKERALLIARREISDRIAVEEPMNALSSSFFINTVKFELDTEDRYWITWVPAVADSTQYWFLEIPGFTELNFTTRLGFGLIIGHTDIEHSDYHNDDIHEDLAHADEHGDVAHEDAAHSDSAHTDVAHTDSAHSDVAHSDSHSDAAHGDIGHNDSHSDVAHIDSHGDVSHTDVAHDDVAFQGYTDTHDDVHQDFYTDLTGPPCLDPHCDAYTDTYHDSHIDDGGHPHGDTPHYDVGHSDSHNDQSHSDTHGDVAHTDGIHNDAHSDVSHSDVAHGDNHGDAGHGDDAHADVAHDDSHEDVAHSDVAHNDSHGDTAHGDQN